MKILIPVEVEEPLVQHVVETLKLETVAAREFLRIVLNHSVLMDRKQQDYGSKNISRHGLIGIWIRLCDKFERLDHLLGKKKRKVKNESLIDSLTDLSNYAIIGILVETGKWPNE